MNCALASRITDNLKVSMASKTYKRVSIINIYQRNIILDYNMFSERQKQQNKSKPCSFFI